MTDPDPTTDSNSAHPAPDGGLLARASRWQKVVGIIGLAVLLGPGLGLFGPGSGGEGPGGHAPGGQPPAADATEDGGHAPPGGFDH